jgi:hypothetical protein
MNPNRSLLAEEVGASAMTRDEHRAKCIEAMRSAVFHYRHSRRQFDWLLSEEAIVAFDSLHGIAAVCPLEVTEEMIEAYHSAGYGPRKEWAAMSAAGDLTNAPEKT